MEELIVQTLVCPIKIYDEKLVIEALDKINPNAMAKHMPTLLSSKSVPVNVLDKLMLVGVQIPPLHRNTYLSIITDPNLLDFAIKYIPLDHTGWLSVVIAAFDESQWAKIAYYHDVKPPSDSVFRGVLSANIWNNVDLFKKLMAYIRRFPDKLGNYERIVKMFYPDEYSRYIAMDNPSVARIREKIDELCKLINESGLDKESFLTLF